MISACSQTLKHKRRFVQDLNQDIRLQHDANTADYIGAKFIGNIYFIV